jgi:hypothetical protein
VANQSPQLRQIEVLQRNIESGHKLMDAMMALRTCAAVVTVAGAVLVTVNWSPRLTVMGFAVFVVASISSMIDGYFEDKASLIFQKAILLLVKIGGIYRCLPAAAARKQ